jgi:hypothetical protein
MKKNIRLFILFVFCMLFYNCAQDAVVKGDKEQEDNVTTYSVVATVDFTLPQGCCWNYSFPDGKSSGISVINSQEELSGYLSCGKALSSVDFDKYSLLLAYGNTVSNVHTLIYQLVQVSENEFRLDVEIQLGTEAWPAGWTITALIPKIPQNTTIRLNEVQYEYPYRDNITGTWKLLHSITGDDTLDCSTRQIIYDFHADGKFVISGNMPNDLLEGEHTYVYWQPNVCPLCLPGLYNMQIDNEDLIFCEAPVKDEKMTISGERVTGRVIDENGLIIEQGAVLRWRKTFIKLK